MAYTKIIGIKEKKFSHIRDLYPKPHKSHKINSQNSLGHLKRDLLVLENMLGYRIQICTRNAAKTLSSVKGG